MPPAIGLVKEGKVRALAVTGLARSPISRIMPTVAEAGLPGFEAVLHYGIVAPAGTPRPIVDKLNAALRAALAIREFTGKIAAEAPNRCHRLPTNMRPISKGGDQVVRYGEEVRRVSEIRRFSFG